MTEEEAIEKIKRWKLEVDDEKDYAEYLEGWFYKDDEIAFDMAIEALQEQKWILCSERLPEEGHTYLVTIEFNDGSRGVDMDEYFSYGWDDYGLGNVGRVIAWKPEPEPYWEDNT